MPSTAPAVERVRGRGAPDQRRRLPRCRRQPVRPGGRRSLSADGRTGGRPPTDVTVSGLIRWTDSAGSTHPVRFAPVEIRDLEDTGPEVLATFITEGDGRYSVAVERPRRAGGVRP